MRLASNRPKPATRESKRILLPASRLGVWVHVSWSSLAHARRVHNCQVSIDSSTIVGCRAISWTKKNAHGGGIFSAGISLLLQDFTVVRDCAAEVRAHIAHFLANANGLAMATLPGNASMQHWHLCTSCKLDGVA